MNWKEHLPYLAKQIEEGNIWRYDAVGFTRELTKEQKNKIKEIESESNDLRVVALIDAEYYFEDCKMHFNTYLLIGENNIPEVANYTRKYVVFYSFADNVDDSTCSEFGDVGVIEQAGLLRRIY